MIERIRMSFWEAHPVLLNLILCLNTTHFAFIYFRLHCSKQQRKPASRSRVLKCPFRSTRWQPLLWAPTPATTGAILSPHQRLSRLKPKQERPRPTRCQRDHTPPTRISIYLPHPSRRWAATSTVPCDRSATRVAWRAARLRPSTPAMVATRCTISCIVHRASMRLQARPHSLTTADSLPTRRSPPVALARPTRLWPIRLALQGIRFYHLRCRRAATPRWPAVKVLRLATKASDSAFWACRLCSLTW